jgi:hypothetical protein
MAKQCSRTLTRGHGDREPGFEKSVHLSVLDRMGMGPWDHGTLAVKRQSNRWGAHGMSSIHDLDRT